MLLATSPDGKTNATFEWGGEMGMGGPEWGTVTLSSGLVIKTAQPSALFSKDSQFFAVPIWELPVTGISSPQEFYNSSIRIAVVNLKSGSVRHVGQHMRYPRVEISSVSAKEVCFLANDQPSKVGIERVVWA